MMAAAELFRAESPRVEIKVGTSGTGGGFKKFLEDKPSLRTDINNASRPISSEELQRAAALGVQFIELPVAMDGLAIVVNPGNRFCDHLTVAELRRIWSPDSKITNWSDVREGFPDLPLKLYGPGTDSGTFDFFTEVVVGKTKSCRSDYTASESDNVLVHGVSGDPGALGYFGLAYYEANHKDLKLIGVEGEGGKSVLPSLESVRAGEYLPLSRPLLIYVNRVSADRPDVSAFVRYLLTNDRSIVEHPRVGYVAVEPDVAAAALRRFDQRVVGTAYGEGRGHGASLRELYVTPAPSDGS